MHRFLSNTVFNRIDKRAPANEVLAIILHRSAFTLYGIYMIWGIVYAIVASPQILLNEGSIFINFFGCLIAIFSANAAMGALHFPSLGRLELFAASALIPLIIAFLLLTSSSVLMGDLRALNNLILNCAHLVIPLARVIYIYKTLIHRVGPGEPR